LITGGVFCGRWWDYSRKTATGIGESKLRILK